MAGMSSNNLFELLGVAGSVIIGLVLTLFLLFMVVHINQRLEDVRCLDLMESFPQEQQLAIFKGCIARDYSRFRVNGEPIGRYNSYQEYGAILNGADAAVEELLESETGI